jgi:hypothetical protein
MFPAIYSVTLHHLAPGATAAGLAYPDEQLPAVNITQLREMLYSLSEVATRLSLYEPSSPEIRVKTDRDVFVIRTRCRRLCFVGWESILRGEEHSVSYILSTITGTAEPVKVIPKVERTFASTAAMPTAPAVETGRVPRWAKITVLTVLIIGFNATTAWMLLRPAPTLVPRHEMLAEFESRALLNKVAGEYETGIREGDRHLLVDSDGTLHLAKYGKNKALVEERTKTARGAIVDGRTALITSDPSVLVIKDADTVVLYGTTYRRSTR